MRKLALSLLALVLLASTAIAAPDGWRRLNGAWLNEGVSQQADAIERGGSFYLDLDAKALALYPWQDGSTDVLYMQPVGLEYDGPMVETPYGWKIPLKNHIYGATFLQLVDLQSARVPDALENYLGNGVALIYSGMPVANIPQGEWIPKRIEFSGMVDDCSFTIQDPANFLPGSTYPDWVPYSIAIYHLDKRNSGGHHRYTTGKITHLPRPVAIGWLNGEITGWAYGRYREVSHGVFDKVFFRNAQFDADMTRRGIGNPQTIAVSADLGYNSMGASTWSASADFLYTFGDTLNTTGWLASESGDVDQLVFGLNADTTGLAATRVGVYEDATSTTADVVPDSELLQAPDSADSSGGGWWNRYDYSTKPAITSGEKYRFALAANDTGHDYRYDGTGSGQAIWVKTSQDPATVPLPDPLSETFPNVQQQGSAFIVYTPAAVTPITTNAAVIPTSTPKGSTSVAISCDIDTASETITDAEWFFGADPGEGSGNSFDSLTGTATSKTAAADIDPSALDYAVNVISMRGFDAVNGWGDVDTVELNIILAAPTSVVATPADQQVTVTWVEGADAGDQDLYWDTSSPVTGASTRIIGVSSGEVVGSLTNGVTYFFAVLNNSFMGRPASDFSEEVSVKAGVPVGGAWQNVFRTILMRR